MQRIFALGLVLSLFSACGAPANDKGTTPTDSPVVDGSAGCHIERPTGSNIGREVCRTTDDVERDREEARRLMQPGRVQPRPGELTNGNPP